MTAPRRRPSVQLLFAATLFLGVVVTEIVLLRYEWIEHYKKRYEAQVEALQDEAAFAAEHLKIFGDVNRLGKALDRLQFLEYVDFWVLYVDGAPYRLGMISKPELEKMRLQFTDGLQMGRNEGDDTIFAYWARPIGDGVSVAVGARYNESAYLRRAFESEKDAALIFVGIVVALAAAAFAFYFREISSLLRQLGQRRRAYAPARRARTREAELLSSGLAAYEERAGALERERDQLSGQVLPSLRHELASGRKPPYDFDCTLVRTDINGFSGIYNSRPPDEFLATIDAFFSELSHAVARYGGLMHEFVGDEAIYYFKDEDVGNSVAAALSAIREANAIAARVDGRTSAEQGYSFTVKSALAHGRMRYGRFMRGYNLAGSALIETVRILSAVREKDGNVAVFDARHLGRASAVAYGESYGRHELRGFPQPRELVRYAGHFPIEDYIERAADGDEEAAESLVQFRGDLDIETLILRARAEAERPPGGGARAQRLLAFVRRCALFSSDGRPARALLDWLASALDAAEAGRGFPGDPEARLLSSLIGAVPRVVPAALFDDRVAAILARGAGLERYPRAVANALEALARFDLDAAEAMARPFGEGVDSRLEGGALQVRGMRELDGAVVKRLKRMLASPDPRRRASGLHAIGEIAAHWRDRDVVYMNARLEFMDLVRGLPAFAASGSEMPRRQAIKAARKSGDAEAIDAIRALAARDPSVAQAWDAERVPIVGEVRPLRAG